MLAPPAQVCVRFVVGSAPRAASGAVPCACQGQPRPWFQARVDSVRHCSVGARQHCRGILTCVRSAPRACPPSRACVPLLRPDLSEGTLQGQALLHSGPSMSQTRAQLLCFLSGSGHPHVQPKRTGWLRPGPELAIGDDGTGPADERSLARSLVLTRPSR